MFSLSKDKIDDVYVSLQADFNIEDYGEINKYRGIELDLCLYGSIYLIQTHLIQGIINMITGIDQSRAMLTPAFNPPLAKPEGAQAIQNNFNYRSVIRSIHLLTNSMHPRRNLRLVNARVSALISR